ncbi:MAG: pyridoxal phosphate-dependent aminotransferase [Candidatus Altiarchaeota archaeon]|nr:pyridoxal phosphate-dependent aminotransferase [Candidatus Altiarchaeota archaeon]
MDFASRLDKVRGSATFKYSSLAKGEGILNLTQGLINYETPPSIVEAAEKAMREGKTSYTPTRGIPELREKIALKLEEENNIESLGPENILVSCGAKQVIFEAVMALVDRDVEVAIPNPSWVSYEPIINLAEGKIVWLPLSSEDGFIPGDDFLSKLENSNSRVIFMNSPNNPTGAVYPKKVIRDMVDIAERKDAWILSDEIYEKIIYQGEHFSPASVYDKTITVNGFSKEYSMTGWRLGYCACQEKEVLDKMNIIQSQSVSCATSFVQYAALEAFTEEVKSGVKEMVSDLSDRRDLLVEGLGAAGLLDYEPGGAFYVFPRLGDGDDIKLADRLLEEGVGVIPGSPFGSQGRGCVRISYGFISGDKIREVVEKLSSIEL